MDPWKGKTRDNGVDRNLILLDGAFRKHSPETTHRIRSHATSKLRCCELIIRFSHQYGRLWLALGYRETGLNQMPSDTNLDLGH